MTIPRRRTTVPTLTLDALTINERLDLLSTFWPTPANTSRWRTWPEYLAAYAVLRDELLTQHPRLRDGRLPFAERVSIFAAAHGGEALAAAGSYDELMTWLDRGQP